MSRFVQVDRDTAYLLPPSVQEWLPKDHLLQRFAPEPFGPAPQDPLAAIAHRLKTREGRALYALRQVRQAAITHHCAKTPD